MGGSQPGYLHFLDRLPTTDQRLRRSKIQVIRITRGSGKSLCLFAVRVHQAVGPFSCQDYSRRRRSPSCRRRRKQPCRRRRLQRKSRCHGVPGSTRRQPSGNLSLRAEYGTNNIGEFLAIVHGLALLKQKGFDMPIYSDSVNAINWIKQKKCKTKLPRDAKTEELFHLIERAEKWLRENTYTTRILKWETKQWGEIPADFGRK